MEPITHFLTGAALARCGLNRKTAYATLAMTLAAEAPDIDVFWGLRGPVAEFQRHRGITHTFLGAPFVALAVTGAVWLFDRWRTKRPPLAARWTLIWFFSLIAVLSHIFLDWTNNYGIRPFFPFNPRWYALDIVFIFEPLIFSLLLMGLIAPSLFALIDGEIGARKPLFRGRGWAIAALSGAALITVLRWGEHQRAMHLVGAAQFGSEPAIRAGIEPYPVNPFHWFAIVEAERYFATGLVNTWSGEVEPPENNDVFFKPPVTPAVSAAKNSLLGRAYLDWAAFPLVTDYGNADAAGFAGNEGEGVSPLDRAVEFRDLRFGYSVLSRMMRGGPGVRDANPLAGWVFVGPDGRVDGMEMTGRWQH